MSYYDTLNLEDQIYTITLKYIYILIVYTLDVNTYLYNLLR